jgi:hypothetical protein
MEALNVVASGPCHVENKYAFRVVSLEAGSETLKELGFVQNDTIYQTQIPV